ncbi:MAG: VCBS repeat-containing protein [Chryseosolibacter sp.]
MKISLPKKSGYCLLLNVLLLAGCQEKKSPPLFYSVPEARSNITFDNTLTQTGYFNIIEYLYFYNGGGVSAGDINNDGLTDLYFTANQLQNKLFLNKGDFVFEDITGTAGVGGEGNWKTGTTMADVNGDGLLDIFVCGVGNYKYFNGKNQLFINNGDLTFSDQTEAYGLAFQGFSTHASFFDYDNDGDLDMYLLNHSVHSVRSYGQSSLRYENDSLAGDKLYRNEIVPTGISKFTDVTTSAGIYNSQVAYGLSVGVSDINLDGFLDIYVSNDFHENDYLYVNDGHGKFREELEKSMPHTSRFSMGNDIADINNDGYSDIITLDMLPRDEEVIKTTAGEDSYDIYSYKLRFGYHHQFSRNALQLNRGPAPEGHHVFSDIAPLAGVHASDWSWAPLLADFDNDGNKDLFIANGILTRPNDLDYMNFIASDSAQKFYGYEEFIRNMPSGTVPNFIFRNSGSLDFQDVSETWLGMKPTASTGATYADLDNDGDLDLVINNVNEKASILRNDSPADAHGWLQVELLGEDSNRFGIGAKIIVYAGGKQLYHEQILSRGWQSSVSPLIHIGIGLVPSVDSVLIIWPDKRAQTLHSLSKNKRIKLFQKDAEGVWDYSVNRHTAVPLLRRETLPFKHRENDFNAFNTEKLIPHMISTQGPGLSTGDLNGDGYEDFFIGGAAGQPGQVFFQNTTGNFFTKAQPVLKADSLYEDAGSAFFDADGDGSLDLLVVSGGQQFSGNDPRLRPRLYFNNGSGTLSESKGNLPEIFANASCVKPGDFDNDGDIDVFIGGRVIAGQYGISPESFLLVNDGKGRFKNESRRLDPQHDQRLGMVTDAAWNDLNADGKPDLVVVGEWMPVTVLIQDVHGDFVDKTPDYGLSGTNGWWNTLEAEDFDKDGDIDFVAGNLGLNSRLKASRDRPVTFYVGDMDENGGTDHLLTYFNDEEEYPFISRDQLVKQVPSFRRKFLKYDNFRKVKREHIISGPEIEKFAVLQAYCFSSVYLENRKGTFAVRPLPVDAQMFPVFSLCSGDFNHDGNKDLLAVGNLYAVQPDFGRYDAGYGLMMEGDGKGSFKSQSLQESGFLVTGEGRSVEAIKSTQGQDLYVVGRNNESLLLFR